MGKEMRTEKDLIGFKKIPKDVYWGINTERAIENYHISELKNHKEFIKAILEIKMSAISLYKDFNIIPSKYAEAILMACKDALSGKLDKYFVVNFFQSGAGTSLHMNINEVLANRANEIFGFPIGAYSPIHPNDHVNKGQSTNDVIPTATRIATIRLSNKLTKKLNHLGKSFLKKGVEFQHLLKSGRTHLNDATTITLGDEFSAYGKAILKDSFYIKELTKPLYYIGLSGTATGSGLTAPEAYKKHICQYLSKTTKISLKMNESLYESMQNQADFARLMGGIKASALNIIRICNDLRLLASGPNTGLHEINLPEVQAGSSIMPGKVNPSIPEMVTMVSFYVCGMENTISLAVQAGQLELNVMMPLIANCTLYAIEYYTNAIDKLNKRCVKGISANPEIMRKYAETSLGIATILSPILGYEKTAELVKLSKEKNEPILQLIRKQKILSEEEINNILFKK